MFVRWLLELEGEIGTYENVIKVNTRFEESLEERGVILRFEESLFRLLDLAQYLLSFYPSPTISSVSREGNEGRDVPKKRIPR